MADNTSKKESETISNLDKIQKLPLIIAGFVGFSVASLFYYTASNARYRPLEQAPSPDLSLLDIDGDGQIKCWEVKTKEWAVRDYHTVCDEFKACDSGVYQSLYIPNPRYFIDVNGDGQVNLPEVNTIEAAIQKFYQRNRCEGEYGPKYVGNRTRGGGI